MPTFDDYRNITINVDGANDWIPEVRLSGGDVDGRTLTVSFNKDGLALDDMEHMTARLLFNPQPNTAFPGAYKTMTYNQTSQTFSVTVPRAAFTGLTGSHTRMAVELQREVTEDGAEPKTENVCTRTFNAIVDPSVLKAGDGTDPDPLEEWHELINHGNEQIQDITDRGNKVIANMQQLVDTANIEAGTVTELEPNQKPTFELVGEKWDKTMNLGLPRGAGVTEASVTELNPNQTPTATLSDLDNGDKSVAFGLPRAAKIVSATATAAAQDAEPTVTVADSADGDQTLAFTLPRGPKGDKGDKGNAGDIATRTTPGIVYPSNGMTVDSAGGLSLKSSGNVQASSRPGKWVDLAYDIDNDKNIVLLGDGLQSGGSQITASIATADTAGRVKPGFGLTAPDDEGKIDADILYTYQTPDVYRTIPVVHTVNTQGDGRAFAILAGEEFTKNVDYLTLNTSDGFVIDSIQGLTLALFMIANMRFTANDNSTPVSINEIPVYRTIKNLASSLTPVFSRGIFFPTTSLDVPANAETFYVDIAFASIAGGPISDIGGSYLELIRRTLNVGYELQTNNATYTIKSAEIPSSDTSKLRLNLESGSTTTAIPANLVVWFNKMESNA